MNTKQSRILQNTLVYIENKHLYTPEERELIKKQLRQDIVNKRKGLK